MKRILWIGDGATPTGFSTVNHNIIKRLPKDWEVHHLAINYFGDPHDLSWKLYPARNGGDIFGLNRIKEFENRKVDAIFILNDIWMVDKYLEEIKKWKRVPPVIIYFPVDAINFNEKWFKNFDIVSVPVTYTNFAKSVCEKVAPQYNYRVIGHGLDRDTFFKIDKHKVRKQIFKDFKRIQNGFIFLQANRNQIRKRLDISLEAFALFAEGKENVFYYHHAGLKDVGWDIISLVKRFDIDDKFITTNLEKGIQKIPAEKLNLIYNACDVHLNSSLGEGWGLNSMISASLGKPLVVPNHSVMKELYGECSLLVEPITEFTYEQTMTTGKIIHPVDMAEQMEKIYSDKELYNKLSTAGIEKFSKEEYSWDYVANQFKELFEMVF